MLDPVLDTGFCGLCMRGFFLAVSSWCRVFAIAIFVCADLPALCCVASLPSMACCLTLPPFSMIDAHVLTEIPRIGHVASCQAEAYKVAMQHLAK